MKTIDPRTMGLLVSDMNTIGPRTMGAWPRTIGLSISDFNTIALSISDFTTIALGLTPNVRCSAARAGGRGTAGGGRAGGRAGAGGRARAGGRAGGRGRSDGRGLSGGCQGQRLVVNSNVMVRGQFNLPPMAFIALVVAAQWAQRSISGDVSGRDE